MINENTYISKDVFDKIRSELLSDHIVLLNSGGYSMFPVIRAGDRLIVQKVQHSSLKKGDVIVFEMNGKTLAHRIIHLANKNGEQCVITQGDNCRRADNVIQNSQIIGKVNGFLRNEKEYLFNTFYYQLWLRLLLICSIILRPMIRLLFRITQSKSKLIALVKSTKSNVSIILKDSKRIGIEHLVISILQAILPFAIIYAIKKIVDYLSVTQLTKQEPSMWHLELLIAFCGAVFLLHIVVNSVAHFVREKLAQSVSLTVHELLHTKMAQLGFEHLENADQQDTIHRATVEAGFRPNKILGECFSFIRSAVAGLIIVVLMFSIHWIIVVLLLAGLTPVLLLRMHNSKILYDLHKKQSKSERQTYYYNRILTGMPFAKELRLFATMSFFRSRFAQIQQHINNEKKTVMKKHLIVELIIQSLSIALMFVSFGVIMKMAVSGQLGIGTVVLFFMLFQRGFVILNELFQSLAGLYEDTVFFADFVAFLKLPSVVEHKTSENPFPVKLQQEIHIANVSFQYPSSSRMALRNINMKIPAGKTIAIVGANGSGKTTLMKLLCGFYQPDNGFIAFDDVKLTASNQPHIRTRIAAVFQDFALYNMTVAENIWLGNTKERINNEKITSSSQKAGIDSVIENLPLGYQNMIGNFFEKGEELSIGQWQKIAIARAFYRNSDILFMDEPTSALDAETETQIVSSLQALAQNKTVIIVSHRFSTIQWADQIYVMENGEIIESGTHNSLMQRNGRYFELYNFQRN